MESIAGVIGPLHGPLSSALVYAALCLIALAVGRGLLRMLRFRGGPALLLAPVAALAFWTVALGILVGLSVPVRHVAPWLWAATALVGLTGLRPWPDEGRRPWGVSSLCAALPVLVMAPYFWSGLSDHVGSVMPDGWSYIATGQYLWEHRRGVEVAPVPLYQFAQHLSGSRYIGSSLLAFFSPLVQAGDTQAVSSLLQAWTLCCSASAVAFFAVAAGFRAWMAMAVATLSTASGWIANLVWANNFDNGLALAYIPALAAVLGPAPAGWRCALVRGGLLAGAFYTYPELAPAVIGGAVLIALPGLVEAPGGMARGVSAGRRRLSLRVRPAVAGRAHARSRPAPPAPPRLEQRPAGPGTVRRSPRPALPAGRLLGTRGRAPAPEAPRPGELDWRSPSRC